MRMQNDMCSRFHMLCRPAGNDLSDAEEKKKESKKEGKTAQEKAVFETLTDKDAVRELKRIEKLMMEAARNLEFEKAAKLRDQLTLLKERVFGSSGTSSVEALSTSLK